MLAFRLPPHPTKNEMKLYLETYPCLKWEIVKPGRAANTVSLSSSQEIIPSGFPPRLLSPSRSTPSPRGADSPAPSLSCAEISPLFSSPPPKPSQPLRSSCFSLPDTPLRPSSHHYFLRVCCYHASLHFMATPVKFISPPSDLPL